MSEAPSSPPPDPSADQRVGEPGNAKPPRRHSRRWHLPRGLHVGLVLLCVTLIGLATWLASRQPLHPDPFRRIDNWDVGQADWWAYPLERNAFKRTLVQGDLRAVFHLPGTELVWVVGQGGLILHSGDGGRSWSQQNPRVDSPAGETTALLDTHPYRSAAQPFDWAGWVPSAHAAAPSKEPSPNLMQQSAVDPSPVQQQVQQQVQPVRQVPAAPQLNVSPELAKELEAKSTYQTTQRAAQKIAVAKVNPAKPAAASAPASAASAGTAKQPDVDLWRSMLRAVIFLNARQGWVVGDHGTILVTEDGGAHWRRLPTPKAVSGTSDVALRSIAFAPDGKHAWIVGDAGTFLHSEDGGENWKPQGGVTAKPDMLTGISINANGRGLVVGQAGAAYGTTNGGTSWSSITSVVANPSAGGVLKALAVSQSAEHSWAVGVDGDIERYKDGEGTTTLHPLTDQSTLRGVSAVGSGAGERVWAVGDDGMVLRSLDGGQSWQSLPRQTDSTLRGVRFDPDGQRGWVVGDDGTLLATSDGGVTWVRQAGSDAVFADVAFAADGRQGWATGPYGLLLQTTDGGASWRPQVLTDLNNSIRPASLARVGHQVGLLRSLAIAPDGRKVWAVGDAGTLFHTQDGGQHWVLAALVNKADLHKATFADDGQRGLAVGDGVILSTANGGQSWSAMTFFEPDGNRTGAVKLVTTDLFGVSLSADGSKAWAVGAKGAVFVSPDGGKNWVQQRVLTHEAAGDLLDVAVASGGQRAWAVGEHGNIASTQDGGSLWVMQTMASAPAVMPAQAATTPAVPVAPPAAPSLRSVAVQGNGTVWAAGDNVLLQSRNSGATWEAQPMPGSTVRLVRFTPGSQRGWLVGDGASLHTTTDGGAHWQPQALYERHWAPWYAAALVLLSLALAVLLGFVESGEQAPVEARVGSVAHILSSDQPVSDKSGDRLGFTPAVEALSAFIRNAHTEPRITLAVTGEWGSGKSSIMRMLQTDLEQAGFRTAWFNAWHHQQEGRQLAALFNVVRQQAVPQLWHQPFAWLRVRSRLIWGRGFFYQMVAVAMVVVLAVAAGDLFSVGYGQALDNLKLNVQHYVLQERQTIVTGGTLDKLDPFRRQVAKSTVIAAVAAAASSPDLLAAAGPAANGDAAVATVGSTDTPAVGNTGNSAGIDAIVQAAGKPTSAGNQTAKTAQDPCDNTALKLQLQKAVPVRPEVYCYMKRALLWEPSGQMQQCGDTRPLPPERHCVFTRPQDLVATIKAHIQGDKLRPSEEQAILGAAETLPPPVLFPWLQRSLLGGLVGFIVLLFSKGWTIGGLQILQPIKNLLNIGSSGKGDTDKEPTGTVERCRAEFGVLTDALRGRLVIFIDDLDRCTADTVNGLMELTNYLVDVGQCFVVLGAAMDRVMLCIKPPVAPPDPAAAREYAQAYLRKLVHVELPVPLTRNRLHELMDEPKPTPQQRNEPRWHRVLDGLRGLVSFELKWLRRIVWIALVVGLTYLAFITGARLQTGVEGQAQMIDVPNAVAESVVPRPDAPAPSVMTTAFEPVDQTERVKPSALLTPGAGARIEPRWWWVIGLLLPLSGFALNWVQRYRARLTVVLGGVIRSHDSDLFMKALRLWKDVVIAHDPTPRHVKRFYNRARLFSAYEQRDGADRKLLATHDAHLVMMAALHYTEPERLKDLHDGVLSFGGTPPALADQEKRLNQLLNHWPPALKLALWAHLNLFGGLPTAEQIQRFEERLAGLRVS